MLRRAVLCAVLRQREASSEYNVLLPSWPAAERRRGKEGQAAFFRSICMHVNTEEIHQQ